MATTTNFGWETPDDTDLVKDGALAMRTLGNAIDASMVDLKGGTTGQVLSKASNTDMDFTWVAQDDSNAIQNSIVDAKGDLIAASAADTPARLAVGNNGETLVADSSTSTGLRWQQPKTQNVILNSNMAIWQRGTSRTLTADAGYCADRWQMRTDGATAQTYSRQATGDTTNLPNIQYCIRAQRDSGQTAARFVILEYSMESADTIQLTGQTVTLSFYARRGANFSGSSNQITVNLRTGTGTDQNVGSNYTGDVLSINQTPTLTTTWQRFSYTATLSTTANELGLQFYYTTSGTAGAADYFELTGVQLEVGSVATPYRPYSATLAGELAACQRYYWRFGGSYVYEAFGIGSAANTTAIYAIIKNPVTFRVKPTAIEYANLSIQDGAGGNVTFTSLTNGGAALDTQLVQASGASGLTQYRPYFLSANNSTSAYIAFSAEL